MSNLITFWPMKILKTQNREMYNTWYQITSTIIREVSWKVIFQLFEGHLHLFTWIGCVIPNWPRNSARNLMIRLPFKNSGWRLIYSLFSYQIGSSTPKVNKMWKSPRSWTSLLLPLYASFQLRQCSNVRQIYICECPCHIDGLPCRN